MDKAILRNAFASIFEKIIRIVEQLALIPFFIAAWGIDYYGDFLTLTILPMTLALLDFGFGTASSNKFVFTYLRNDIRESSLIIKKAHRTIGLLCFLSIIFSLLLLPLLFRINFFGQLIIPEKAILLGLPLLVGARFIDFYGQFHEGFFRVLNETHKSIWFYSIYGTLKIGFTYILLKYGGTFLEYSLMIFFLALILNYIIYLGSKKGISVTMTQLKLKNSLDIQALRKGIGFMLIPMWQLILFQGSTYLVKIYLGSAMVVLFNTSRTLSRSLIQLYSILNSSIFTHLQLLIVNNLFVEAKKLLNKALIVSVSIAIIGSAILYKIGPYIYSYWTGKDLKLDNTFWFLTLLGIVFNSIWWTYGSYFRASNNPKYIGIIGVLLSLFSLILATILIKYFNLSITGMALGLLCFEISMSFFITKKVHMSLKPNKTQL